MKKKCLILTATLLVIVVAGSGQDTSKLSAEHLKNNSSSLNSPVYPDSGTVNQNRKQKAHAAVNSNRGTMIPNTTSGTLNSTVNPNTELVIPIRKKKRKPISNVIPDSGATDAGKK